MASRLPLDLELAGYHSWPSEIFLASKLNLIPKLIEAQDQFIDLLSLADRSPDAWKLALASTTLPPKIFLKHLHGSGGCRRRTAQKPDGATPARDPRRQTDRVLEPTDLGSGTADAGGR